MRGLCKVSNISMNKELKTAYKRQLQQIHQTSFENFQSPLDYFITYLRFMRDAYLLQTTNIDTIGQENLELAALVTALSEYEKSEQCFHKYYKETNGVVARLCPEESDEETLSKYSKEKAFHLNAFWSLVRLNIENWGTNVKL